ncbi:TPA: hypothetical protein N0F65_002697 [Lagenidium giganteum]|uniref:Uncharacterized protein n=1 Tax=Lagenidium giganteum TaxID=4803 RepID=A0AAV2Z4H6_9STRA|nr:TPA: hypothetical protein N0F65_002697 [Lagenidium giganteum]
MYSHARWSFWCPDPAIQDLIRKFSLHDPVKEAEEEREFYRRLGIKRKASSTRKNTTPTKIRRTSSEGSAQKIQFELQPRKSDVPLYFLLEPLRNPNMRTDPTLKIMYLKKYIAMKLRLDTPDEVAILCKGTSVGAEYSLEFVRRTVWQDEGQKMRLEFHRQLV